MERYRPQFPIRNRPQVGVDAGGARGGGQYRPFVVVSPRHGSVALPFPMHPRADGIGDGPASLLLRVAHGGRVAIRLVVVKGGDDPESRALSLPATPVRQPKRPTRLLEMVGVANKALRIEEQRGVLTVASRAMGA